MSGIQETFDALGYFLSTNNYIYIATRGNKKNPFDIKNISPLQLGIKNTHSMQPTFARKGLIL